jgi:hypothetical protein
MSQFLKQATDFDSDTIRLAGAAPHRAPAALNTKRLLFVGLPSRTREA